MVGYIPMVKLLLNWQLLSQKLYSFIISIHVLSIIHRWYVYLKDNFRSIQNTKYKI